MTAQKGLIGFMDQVLGSDDWVIVCYDQTGIPQTTILENVPPELQTFDRTKTWSVTVEQGSAPGRYRVVSHRLLQAGTEPNCAGAEFMTAMTEPEHLKGVILAGIVKREKDDPGAIQFSEGTSCERWTRISVEMIEKVDLIQTVACEDHRHPFVHLHFKPARKNPEAAVFAALLRGASLTVGISPLSQHERRARPALASQAGGVASRPPGGSPQSRRDTFGMAQSRATTAQAVRMPQGARSAVPVGGRMLAMPLSSARVGSVAEGWEFVASFPFDEIDACFYLFFVEVYRQSRAGSWDYKVGINHGGVLQGGGCDCFPGQFRTGWVQARVDGTGGGFLDTGGLDVHSGGGEVWQYFYSIYPGELQSCSASWETWCTS